MRASISLTLVLPTEPVTAADTPAFRARAARPSFSSPISTSSTSSPGWPPSTSRETSAASAPAANALATKSCPSRASFSATNISPGLSERVSIETPITAQVPSIFPPVAFAASSDVHSGSGPFLLCTGASRFLERSARHIEVGERNGHALHDLAGLVALAGDQQRIACLKPSHAFENRSLAVADLAGIGHALADRRADLGRVF